MNVQDIPVPSQPDGWRFCLVDGVPNKESHKNETRMSGFCRKMSFFSILTIRAVYMILQLVVVVLASLATATASLLLCRGKVSNRSEYSEANRRKRSAMDKPKGKEKQKSQESLKPVERTQESKEPNKSSAEPVRKSAEKEVKKDPPKKAAKDSNKENVDRTQLTKEAETKSMAQPEKSENPGQNANEFETKAVERGEIIPPKKVKHMGNIDDIFVPEGNRREELLKECENMDAAQSKQTAPDKKARVTINENQCKVFETNELGTIDDEAEADEVDDIY